MTVLDMFLLFLCRSELKLEHMTDDERSTHETGSSSGAVSENKRRERRPKPHSEYNTT